MLTILQSLASFKALKGKELLAAASAAIGNNALASLIPAMFSQLHTTSANLPSSTMEARAMKARANMPTHKEQQDDEPLL